MNKKQDIQNQIEKLKEEIKTLEDKVEGLDKKGSEKNWTIFNYQRDVIN